MQLSLCTEFGWSYLRAATRWPGSQRAYLSAVTITSSQCPHLREAHPCASRTQTSLTHTPIMLLPSRAPHTHVLHKCFTQPWGPSHGVNRSTGLQVFIN